jgi:hypothetical protein
MTLTQTGQLFSIATNCVVMTSGIYSLARVVRQWRKACQWHTNAFEPGE